MKIWLDLASPPQVLFFEPILRGLEQRGHEVNITARDYAQTIQLIDRLGIQYVSVGKHGGKGKIRLTTELFRRAGQLMNWARLQKFDRALSHNSYAQLCAAAMLRIPSVTLMDYEHQPLNHLGFRLAHKVLVPEVFPKQALARFGALKKTSVYPGLKEQVYLSEFTPEINYRSKEGFSDENILVVFRPPASWTAYYRFENELSKIVLSKLLSDPKAHVLFLPRLQSQVDDLSHVSSKNLQIASKVYHGPDLLYAADLVVSGGGTMNREAAILGTPVFSIFKGRSCAVDEMLVQQGRLIKVLSENDVDRIEISRCCKIHSVMKNRGLKDYIVDQILK